MSSLVNLPRRADVSGSAMSLGRVMTPSVGKIASARPASTSATVYGMRTLRTRIATPLTSRRRRTKTISSWMRVDSVLPCATNEKNMAGRSSFCRGKSDVEVWPIPCLSTGMELPAKL